jgi:hypothetical protein
LESKPLSRNQQSAHSLAEKYIKYRKEVPMFFPKCRRKKRERSCGKNV